jgi:16S rRNA (uracil1498-N3)-methyltransferase
MHSYFFKGYPTDEVVLNETESQHAVKVMREKDGGKVLLINGEGWECVGEIIDAHPKRCRLRMVSKHYEERNTNQLAIAISPTKSNDRIEWFLEKATEIGVDVIIPLECSNQERSKINLARWEKIILSAVKQSRRKWSPLLRAPMRVDALVKESFDGVKLIAYCESLPDKGVQDFINVDRSKLVLIGPEGDFTQEELKLAKENGFVPIHLGQNRLRTETAGVVVATLLRSNENGL